MLFRSKQVSAQLAERTDYDSPEYHALIERLTYLNERLDMDSTESMEAEIERTLMGLGFLRSDFSRATSEFSGGWRMRIELAKILLRKPDVLLLDEPTNHLDIESIQWLEQFLQSKSKAVLLVSHDRAFIDNVTNRTIEISCGKAYDYRVNYSKFVELRKERVEQQQRAYENQQKQIAEIKDFIERFRYKPTKSNQVQSRIKQLEKIVPIEVDEVDNSALHLKFPPAPRSGDFPLILENVGKSYGDHNVFSGAMYMRNRRWEVKIDYENPITENIKLQAGYQGNFSHENSPQESYVDDTWEGTNSTEDKEYFNRFIYDMDLHALYATATLNFGKFGVMAGLRGEYWKVNTESYTWEQEHDATKREPAFKKDYFQLFPSVFMSYQLTKTQQLQLNYTRRLRRPWGGQLNSFRNTREIGRAHV